MSIYDKSDKIINHIDKSFYQESLNIINAFLENKNIKYKYYFDEIDLKVKI